MGIIEHKRMTVDEVIRRFVPRITTTTCEVCAGRGYIAQWIQGKPQFKHMGRCEQCSGFGRVKS